MRTYTATTYHIGHNFDENYIVEEKNFDLLGSALTYANNFYSAHLPTATAPIVTNTTEKFTLEFDYNHDTYIVVINK